VKKGRDNRERERPALEETIYGLRACLAVIERRPAEVLAIAHSREVKREIAIALQFASARKLSIRELPDAELTRLAESNHHEGICVLTKPRAFASPREVADRLVRERSVAIALDRVRNPYNIGAILRTAAFFGVPAAILGSPAPHPALPRDAVRVAEGGAEALMLSRTTDLADTIARLRERGIRVVGADVAATSSAIGFRFERPTVLVVGHEREGMSERVRAQCDALVKIVGSGVVESLNVAVATGVLVAELTRP
jgi:TrmH RNA methyltransferase